MNIGKLIALICCFLSIGLWAQEPSQAINDIDGNVYKTIKIGNQTWMQENLRATHYGNGDEIKTLKPDTLDLTDMVQPIYQWAYKSKDSLVADYGRLYTWFVVTDKRNICPSGWHVPTDNEFCILENFLEPGLDPDCNKVKHRGTNIGNLLKEAGHKHWGDPETGANNYSGFTGLPSGVRYFTGKFDFLTLYGSFWSATEFDSKKAWNRRLYHNEPDISRAYYFKKDSYSVRCIKD